MRAAMTVVLFCALAVISAEHLSWLVGIVDEKTLESIDRVNGALPAEEFELQLEQEDQEEEAKDTGCDYPNFLKLYNQFTIDAGFDQSLNYTNGTVLKAAVNNVFQNLPTNDLATAQKAFDSFCMAQRIFFQNLGIVQIGACILPNVFVAEGFDRTSAYQLFQVFNQLNYQCGAAFKSYTSALLAYLNNMTSQKPDLEKCTDDFLATLNTIPADHGCSAMQTYEHCYGKVYYQATKNSDLAWTVCEEVRRVNVLVLPKCHDTTWFCQISAIIS